jgi:hypothetical protein
MTWFHRVQILELAALEAGTFRRGNRAHGRGERRRKDASVDYPSHWNVAYRVFLFSRT